MSYYTPQGEEYSMTTPTQPMSDEELRGLDAKFTPPNAETSEPFCMVNMSSPEYRRLRERLRLAEEELQAATAVCEGAAILTKEVLEDYSAWGEAVDVNYLLDKWRATRGGA